MTGFNLISWREAARLIGAQAKAGEPYRRARIVSQLVALANSFPSVADRTAALAAIPPYRSRGKGRGSADRNYGNKPCKYTPHQGARECARRVRQRVAAAGPRFNVPT